MKYLILTLLLSQAVFSQDLDIQLNTTQNQLSKLISPIWQNIDYEYDLKNLQTQPLSKEETISYKLISSKLNLAPTGSPLFNINITSKNKGLLLWKLDSLRSTSEVKIRFKYKQFGIQITHDEYFKIKADSINNATSEFELIKNNSSYEIKVLNNNNFSLSSIDVEPRDGIGSVLRYIFDNIFSKDSVDEYIKDSINTEISNWIKKESLIKSIESEINNAIQSFENKVITFPEFASSFNIKINTAKLTEKKISLNTEISFNELYPLHQCANEIPYSKDIIIKSSHKLVETMLTNIGINEVIKDEKIQEPLFCFGYKELDQQGLPVGETLKTKFLGKSLSFNYWVKPTERAVFTYDSQVNSIGITLELKAIIKSTTYPKVFAYKDRILLKQNIQFTLRHSPKGLVLDFKEASLQSITGKLKIKWNRYSPKITLPLSIVKAALSKEIRSSLANSFKQTTLIPNTFDLHPKLQLFLKQYKMDKIGHEIELGIK